MASETSEEAAKECKDSSLIRGTGTAMVIVSVSLGALGLLAWKGWVVGKCFNVELQ